MAWDFDYKKAWKGLARPMLLALGPKVLNLVQQVALSTVSLRQNKALGMDWPASDMLQRLFMTINPDVLLRAQDIVNCYGHWYSGRLVAPVDAWVLPDVYVDNAGGHWKFQTYAKQYLIDIGKHPSGRPNWDTVAALHDDNLKPTYYTHTPRTDLCDEECKYKYGPLLAPLFTVQDVRACNYRVEGYPGRGHPFMIGAGHFPKDNGMYIVPEQHGCYWKADGIPCGLPYEDHKHDKVLMIKPTRNCTNAEAAAALFKVKQDMVTDKIDGVGFIKNEFAIAPVIRIEL